MNRMKNELEANIKKINDNLAILPLNTKSGRAKYLEYINATESEYLIYLNCAQEEIEKRYQCIMSLKANPALQESLDKKYNLDIICYQDSRVAPYNKMNLDEMIYQLDHFYKSDLANVNKTILDIMDKFAEVGIKLTLNDFNYSTYEKDYIKSLLENKDNIETMQYVFDKVYWQCPEIIKHIELNYLQIYYKYEKSIENYYTKKYSKDNYLSNYVKEYNANLNTINIIKHNDNRVLLDAFLNKELSTNSFNAISFDKSKEKTLGNHTIEENYDNLLKLEDNLNEYKNYLTYELIIKKLKELFKDKQTYKGLFDNKLKDIKKKEGELAKLNGKLKPSLFNHPNAEKISETQLLISTKITELQTAYEELEALRIKNTIFKYINPDSTILDVLLLAVADYNFIVNTYKEADASTTTAMVNEKLPKLKSFIYDNSLSIINNLTITSEKNIPQIIADRYKLMNIIINEESLNLDSINTVINDINNLIISADMKRNNFSLDDVEFVMDVNKKGIIEQSIDKS